MNKDINWFLRFYWPAVDEWSIDIKDAWKVFLWLDKIFKKYVKFQKSKWNYNIEWQLALKTWKINNKCTEVVVDVVSTIIMSEPVETLTATHTIYTIAKWVGVQEFWKQFFGVLWKELGLKLIWKGKEINYQTRPKAWPKGQAWVEIIISDWVVEWVELEVYEFYKWIVHDLNYFYILSQDEAEVMKVWYTEDSEDNITGEVSFKDRNYFTSYISHNFDERMWEKFKEEESKPVIIIWKLIEYHGLAHKYHFSFQVRKNQETYGKKKILCIVDEDQHSRYIDLLKPENKWNIKISGLATFDNDEKIDKIKISNFTHHLDWDPDQKRLIEI